MSNKMFKETDREYNTATFTSFLAFQDMLY